TSDAMNKVGPKGRCHANPSTQYLAGIPQIADSLKRLKQDPRNILFAAIAGDPSKVAVELRLPPGDVSPIPTLAHACMTSATDGTAVDPAVRIFDMANEFPRQRVQTACSSDLVGPMTNLAREMRSMMGRDPCLTRDIKLPADCTAFDTNGGGLETTL